jgi:hypothetical protein
MATRSAESPLPVLIVIILAAMSLIQLIAPDLLHPGLTLFLIGIVFLVLHFINWLKDATTLVTGWILAGFGLGFWATTFEVFDDLSLVTILFGMGLSFLGIYITASDTDRIDSRRWPLVPGVLLLLVGVVLVLEGSVGRERLWSYVVPLIPSAIAVWYLIEWRRRAPPAMPQP